LPIEESNFKGLPKENGIEGGSIIKEEEKVPKKLSRVSSSTGLKIDVKAANKSETPQFEQEIYQGENTK
jgi:hypothetical protein